MCESNIGLKHTNLIGQPEDFEAGRRPTQKLIRQDGIIATVPRDILLQFVEEPPKEERPTRFIDYEDESQWSDGPEQAYPYGA